MAKLIYSLMRIMITIVCLAAMLGSSCGGAQFLKFEGFLKKSNIIVNDDMIITLLIADVNTGKAREINTECSLEPDEGKYYYEAHLDDEDFDGSLAVFNLQSEFEISVLIRHRSLDEPEIVKKFRVQPPAGGWEKCTDVDLNTLNIDKYTHTLNPNEINGRVWNGKTREPVENMPCNLKSYSTLVSKHFLTDQDGLFIFGDLLGDEYMFYAPDDEQVFKQRPDYYRTVIGLVKQPDEGEIVSCYLWEQLDWIAAENYARYNLGINQDPDNGAVFGKVVNYFGVPIPDAVVELDPPSGEVTYYDPNINDASDKTQVMPGYYLSSTFIIFNATFDNSFNVKAVAKDKETGEIIGESGPLLIPRSNWGLAQARIVAYDKTLPATIDDLYIFIGDPTTLNWTAPGDDGIEGLAFEYDIRYSTEHPGDDIFVWWHNIAEKLDEPPSPAEPGTFESIQIPNLDEIFVVIRTRDEAQNWSKFSNVAYNPDLGVDDSHKIKVNVRSDFTAKCINIKCTVGGNDLPILKIFDIAGRKIEYLHKFKQTGNSSDFTWYPEANGIYFVLLKNQGHDVVRKLIVAF